MALEGTLHLIEKRSCGQRLRIVKKELEITESFSFYPT